jgi:hypothetical protein
VIVVIVRATDDARVAEALRAGLGLTLRGDRVTVFATSPLPAAAARAAATLRSFGHDVIEDAPADRIARAIHEAHAVEVWT